MAKQTINIGAAPNDGTGTPLRTSFDYCNQNFTELYTATGPSGNNIVVPGSATITGDLTVDTSTLKVDSTNNRVGIGTASPTSDLDIFRASGSGITSGISLRTAAGAGGDGSFIKWLSGGSNEKVAQIDGVLNGTDVGYLSFQCGNGADAMAEQYRIASSGLFTWYDGLGGTRMTLNSTGLGVGRSPAYKLDVSSATASNQLRISGSNQNSITFANAAAGASNGFLMGRSFSSDDANNFFVFDLATSALRLFIGNTGNVGIGTAGPTEAVDLNSGNLKLTNGNVVIGTSGKGIDFSATASGSGTMTSELLNDYEEGTWTGTLTGGTTNPTTPVTATGRYTKVGRSVTVQIAFSAANTTGASGLIGITGLPFANNSVSNSVGSASLYLIANFTGSPFASLGVNESFINFYSNNSGGAFLDVTHNAGTPRFLSVSITYTV